MTMIVTLKRILLNNPHSWLIYSRYLNVSNAVKIEKADAINKNVSSVKPYEKSSKHTWVGPPDPVSNLRLKVFPTSKDLTREETHFYDKSKEIQEWNQQYWELHNRDFEQSKDSYMERIAKERKLESKNCVTAEDMAPFYKEFLDRNYKRHVSYNWEWYRKNFELLYLSAVAQLSKLRKSVKKNNS